MVSKLAKVTLTDIGEGSGKFCDNNRQYSPEVFSDFTEPRTGSTRMNREIQGMYLVADGMALVRLAGFIGVMDLTFEEMKEDDSALMHSDRSSRKAWLFPAVRCEAYQEWLFLIVCRVT